MARFRNVSGQDLEVPAHGQVVAAGDVLEVDDEQAAGLAGQAGVWEPVAPAKKPAAPAKRTRTAKPAAGEPKA